MTCPRSPHAPAIVKRRTSGRIAAMVVIRLLSSSPGHAQSARVDLALVSIEDLMNIEITSASHKRQRTVNVAAAVSVITQDDIRHSGMTTVAELLRLVPGVQVAQINSNKWAVGVRGFNNLFAEKLLVLVDGRTVYDRLNSGLFWESVNIPLDQIDRIEVVRGPGGATWGANAVNGVINIVTKSAADLPGGAVSAGLGSFDGNHVAARFGGTLGETAYRVYSQWAGHDESRVNADTPADDRWHSQAYGFRLDRTADRDTLMLEGGAKLARLRGLFVNPEGPVPAVPAPFDSWSATQEYDALGRWSRRLSNGATWQLQSSFDFRRNEDSANPTQIQSDVDAQYHPASAGGRHDVVAGAGYRHVDEQVQGGFTFAITPAHVVETVVNLFAQDEIALGQRVHLTVGAKLEHDGHVGWDLQPTARLMWTVTPRQRVWTAVSRALRTPSLGDLSSRFNFASFVGPGGVPVVVGALGNPAFQSERVITTEAGYRVELGPTAAIDVAGFVGQYDHLKTNEPLAPRFELTPAPAHVLIPVQFDNLLEATTTGAEVAAHWTPTPWWRIEASYSAFHLTPYLSSASHDTAAPSFDGNAPRAQWQTSSVFLLPRRATVGGMLFHAGALVNINVPAYTRADARFELPLSGLLSLSITGQNLLHATHVEYGGVGAIVTPTLIPRSAAVNLVWAARR